MDTSETYIAMCDCEEIQDGRTTFVPGISRSGDNVFAEVDPMSSNGHHVWLPRQDQIQEMILDATPDFDTSIRHETLVCNFAYFCGARNEDAEGRSNVSIRKKSLEVLWLAFYMYLIHKKCWGGEGWESWDKWENSQDYKYGLGLTPQNWDGEESA